MLQNFRIRKDMEVETISKNTASPKSQTSRKNLKLFTVFTFFPLFSFSTMAQDVATKKSSWGAIEIIIVIFVFGLILIGENTRKGFFQILAVFGGIFIVVAGLFKSLIGMINKAGKDVGNYPKSETRYQDPDTGDLYDEDGNRVPW